MVDRPRCASSSALSLSLSLRRRPPPQSCNFVLFRVNARRPGVRMDGWMDGASHFAPSSFSLPPSVCLPGSLGVFSDSSSSSGCVGRPDFLVCCRSRVVRPPICLKEREVLERKGTTTAMGKGGRERPREGGPRGRRKAADQEGDQI